MASLSTNGDGLRRILFKARDGRRRTLYLGRLPKKQADTILAHVDRMEAAALDGSAPPVQTSQWLAGVSADLREKLERAGLVAERAAARVVTLDDLIAEFKDRPRWREKKPSTHSSYELAFRHLRTYFGATRDVATVTEAEADNLPGYLTEPKPAGAGLARPSANRMVDTASMLFRFAVRSRHIPINPVDGVKRGVAVSQRRAFVDAETSRRVIDAMKDSQWRLLVALARWGGLRTPSEQRGLRWSDVDWENHRFTVRSPKTEHHAGGESRIVPIFPQLRPYFDERWEEAEPGELVLPMMQHLDNSAFRNQLDRTVRKLNLDRWPRIFHNLRSTRQTELEQEFPTYVVCQWLGNSAKIAQRHYLQVTESHFTKATHNPTQHTPELPGMMVNN